MEELPDRIDLVNPTNRNKTPPENTDQDPEMEQEHGSLLGNSRTANNFGMMDGLNITEQKVIKPGLCLVKTETEAIITHNENPINTEGKSNKQIIDMLKNDPNQKDSIYINMEDMEKKFMKGGLLEDTGEVPKDPEEMKQLFYDVQQKHPRKVVDGVPQKLPLCIRTGWFCGCGKCKKSKLGSLGIGMVVYFKFIKALTLAFLFIGIFGAFLIGSYTKNNKDKKSTGYKDLLYKTTLGNVGGTFYNCEKYSYSDITSTTTTTTSTSTSTSSSSSSISTTSDSVTFTLNCQNFAIARIKSFGVSSSSDDEEDNQMACRKFTQNYELRLSKDKCNFRNELSSLVESCQGKTSCSISVQKSKISCSSFPGNKQNFYFTYYCYTDPVNVAFKKTPLTRDEFSYVVVVIDIICMIILISVLSGIRGEKEKNMQEFLEKRTFIRDFTLHLKDIKIPKDRIKEEINDLINHLKEVAKEEDNALELFQFNEVELKKYPQYSDYSTALTEHFNPSEYFVYDVVYPMLTSEKLSAIKKFNNLTEKYSEIDEEMNKLANSSPKQLDSASFAEKDNKNVVNNEVIYKKIETKPEGDATLNVERSGKRKVTGAPQTNDPKTQKKINELFEKKLKILNQIDEQKEKINKQNDITEVNELYITFRNYRIAKFFDSAYKRKTSCCPCLSPEDTRHLYYKGKWLNFSFANDEPSNIKWENVTFDPCKRCLRSCTSLILAIILMIVTLILIIFFKYFERDLGKKFNTNVDCTYVSVNQSDVIGEKDKADNEKTSTYCYCYNQLLVEKKSTKQVKSTLGYDLCDSFYETYLKTTAISTALVVIIPIINAIVVIILKCLTTFQKNKTLSEDMSSNMWKMFILQFVNSGLLLLLVNMRINGVQSTIPNFPFFAGEFTDMDPTWYLKVGAVILFSMILNIITPHIASIGFAWLNCCFRCCDSGCDEGRHTKLKRKRDYYELYTGPVFDIDARYASLLSTLFITLIFSPGAPILLILFFFYLLLTYIIDKIFMLRYYKIPPKFDLHISNMFSNITVFGVVLHMLFAIWVYGNPLLLVNALEKEIKDTSGLGTMIWDRIKMGHNLIIVFFCVVLIVSYCIVACVRVRKNSQKKTITKTNLNSNIDIGLAIPLKQLYKTYTIKKIEYFQSFKDETDATGTYRQNLRLTLEYIRNFILYKVKKNSTNTSAIADLESNFDSGIVKNSDILNIKLNPIIEGDTSYNLAFIPEFEGVAYYEYLKNM